MSKDAAANIYGRPGRSVPQRLFLLFMQTVMLLAVERGELRTAIHTAISELPPNYQAVLILRYQLDLTNQEIADTLGVNKENIEVKIHRARNALRKVLTTKMKGGEQTDALPRV